jgi:hypothetical protein
MEQGNERANMVHGDLAGTHILPGQFLRNELLKLAQIAGVSPNGLFTHGAFVPQVNQEQQDRFLQIVF